MTDVFLIFVTHLSVFNQITIILINSIGISLLVVVGLHNKISNRITQIFIIMGILMFIWVDFAYLARFIDHSYLYWSEIFLRVAWLATPLFFSFLYLISIFLLKKNKQFKLLSGTVFFVGVVLSVITGLTDFVISGAVFTEQGLDIVYGRGFFVFLALIFLIMISTLVPLGKALRGNMNRDQLWSFMVGVLVFYIANSVFNIVLPAFFGITHLYYLGDYSLVFLLGFISYSILRYGLLNIKVISTELFVFTLWVFIFMRAVFANNYEERFVGFGLFVAVVVLGIFLIRGVLYEVQQREELEKLTHRLKKTNKRLKELDTMRKQFLSFASHQVKSPITVVKGYAGLIYDGTYGNVSMKIKDTAKKIVRSADTMISLVNNLLDSRRIEEGRMEFSFEKVHIGSFVRSVADDLRPLAREKGLSFVVHILLGDRVMVSADKQKFTQVLQNLIDNSIKYTERGRVEISVRLDKDKQNVVISVNDTGYGIPKDLIPQLFDQFIRGKETSSRIRGTGLGLYIAKQIVVAHKGTIRADSSGAGRGSTFVVTIPID